MRRKLAVLLVGTMIGSAMLAGCGQNGNTESKQTAAETGELKGDITFWHSFTQGPRLEVIQETADQFMKDNPDVNITIETFSWGGFLYEMDHRPCIRECAGYEHCTSRSCGRDDGRRGPGSPG